MTERQAADYRSRYLKLIRHILARDRESLSREDYEEMEADCLEAALRAVSAYDPNHASASSLDSFVGRYASMARRSYLRRHSRYDDISLDSPADFSQPDGEALVDLLADDRPDDLDASMEQARRMALVRSIADGLPRGQRRALLGALEGRSVPEIVHLAGISRAAVGEAYRHAVEAVRLELDRRERVRQITAAAVEEMSGNVGRRKPDMETDNRSERP